MDRDLNREPDIKIVGLEIWVQGLQFPPKCSWDNDWLNVVVHCNSYRARVDVSGSILSLSEIHYFCKSLEKLYSTLEGSACLDCVEPELYIVINADKLGKMRMEVNITPDHMNQEHKMCFDIDQSFLPELINSCKSILKKYPLEESSER